MFFLFIAANLGKIVAFNSILVQDGEIMSIIRKVFMTLLITGVIYPLIFITGSRTLMAVLYLLQALYIAAVITFYLYFHTYLHWMQASAMISEVISTAGNAAVRLDPATLLSAADLPFFILYIRSTWRKPKPAKRERLLALAVVTASLLVLSVSEAVSSLYNRSLSNIVNDTYAGESSIVERYGTVAANLVSLWQTRSGFLLEKQLEYGGEQVFAATGTSAPNFVIIQVESMDSAIISRKYKGSYVVPYLHSLIGKSVYYPFVLSYHKGGGTSDSEFSILNSVEPLDCYPALKLSNYSYPNSVLTRLKAGGYTAFAFHGNKGGFYNRDTAFPRLGFNEFFDIEKSGLPENGWGLPDADMFAFTEKKLKTLKQPFLAYIITMSSHEPFDSVRNYYSDSRFDDLRDKDVKDYFNSMSYVDRSLKDFIGKLQKDFENTCILITGDHAPNIEKEEYRQASLTLENCFFEFVPLIIITPDRKSYIESSKAASFLDFAPTILESSGTGGSIRTSGSNLLEPVDKAGTIPYRGKSINRVSLFKMAGKSLN